MMIRQKAQSEAQTVAAQLTGVLLNDIARAYTQNVCEIFLVILTFILDISLLRFLEISCHITFMIFTVLEPVGR